MPHHHTLITGATTGIGLATAHHLARAGGHLTLVDRDAAALVIGALMLDGRQR